MKRWSDIHSIVFLILISLFAGAEKSLGSPLGSMFDKHEPKPKKLFVTTLADSGPGSLREALAEADAGATILFKVTGTIFLTNGPLLVATSVMIAGPGSDKLMVDGQWETLRDHVFMVTNNVVATISDLTVTNGRIGGECIHCQGGGIRNLGDLTLIRCVVTGCFSEVGGGGIYSSGSLTLMQCSITGNSTFASGGGILSFGPLTLMQCGVSANSTFEAGGGIDSWGPLTLKQCSVFDNFAQTAGGGIAFIGDTGDELIIDSSTISSNQAGSAGLNEGIGGGIWINGAAFLTNCTVSGNFAAPGAGGGVACFFGGVQFESCTVVSNAAYLFEFGSGNGGGIAVADFVAKSHNSIFAGNISTNRDSMLPPGSGPDISGTLISQGFNLILNTSGAVITGDLQGNTIGVDPLLGPLQDNGGPVFTHALLPGSPAIDAGSPCNFPPTDARGVRRPQDGNGDHIFITDIGAYEKKGKGHGHGPKHEHDDDDDHDHKHDW
jgi:hypothetical protein